MSKGSDGPVSREERLLTAPFLLLTLGHFLQALGFSSMVMLPLYLDHLEADRVDIGWIMGVASVGGLLLRPVVGWALDHYGRRPVLYVGTVLLAAGMAMLGLVRDLGPLVYAARLVFGLGVGACFTGYFTWASDVIPATRRTEGIALFGISGLAPMALNAVYRDLGVAAEDLRLLYPALAGVVALSLLALRRVPEPERATPADGGDRRPWGALLRRELAPVWWATVVFSCLVAVFFAFATVTASGRGVDRPALIWLTYAGGAAFIRLFGARLPDRIGPSNLLAPALASYVVAMLLVAAGADQGDFLLAGLLAGLGHGYCFPVLTSLVVSRAPAEVRGAALAAFTAIWEVAQLVLAPAFGLVADARGDATMFSLAAVVAVAGLAAWAVGERSVLRRTRRAS